MKKIPAQKFGEQFLSLREEILARLEKVCRSGRFILGEEVSRFETDFAAWVGMPQAIGCSSGTDAILLALKAFGVGPGDEVITTPFTYYATVSPIVHAGAKPVFVDIDPRMYTMDVARIEEKISEKTKALIAVHLYGQPCRMEVILRLAAEYKLKVLEDCAQSHGTLYRGQKTGSFGDAGCFSFFPTKNLGAYGDAGAVTVRTEPLARDLRLLRHQGCLKRYDHEKLAYNSRLDELQAAILNVKLKHLNRWIEERRRKAHLYNDLFKEARIGALETPREEDGGQHSYHLYVVRVKDRDRLLEHLTKCDIECYIYYPVPIHLQKAFAFLRHQSGEFPHTEKASAETLAIPLYPELTDEDQRCVVERVKEFFAR